MADCIYFPHRGGEGVVKRTIWKIQGEEWKRPQKSRGGVIRDQNLGDGLRLNFKALFQGYLTMNP